MTNEAARLDEPESAAGTKCTLLPLLLEEFGPRDRDRLDLRHGGVFFDVVEGGGGAAFA